MDHHKEFETRSYVSDYKILNGLLTPESVDASKKLDRSVIQAYIDCPQHIDANLDALFPDRQAKLLIIEINGGLCGDSIRYAKQYPNSVVIAFSPMYNEDAQALVESNGVNVKVMENLINFKNGFDYAFPEAQPKKMVQCFTLLKFHNDIGGMIDFIDYKDAEPEVMNSFGDALQYNTRSMLIHHKDKKSEKEISEIMFRNNFVVFGEYPIFDAGKIETLYINKTIFTED